MDKKLVFLVVFVALMLFLVGCEKRVIIGGDPVTEAQAKIGKEVLKISYGNETPQCADFEEECIADLDCCKGYMCSENKCIAPPAICEYHIISSSLGVLGIVLLFLSIAGQSFFGLWISHVFAKIGYKKIPFSVIIILGIACIIASTIFSGFC